jgi:hypothetical protein
MALTPCALALRYNLFSSNDVQFTFQSQIRQTKIRVSHSSDLQSSWCYSHICASLHCPKYPSPAMTTVSPLEKLPGALINTIAKISNPSMQASSTYSATAVSYKAKSSPQSFADVICTIMQPESPASSLKFLLGSIPTWNPNDDTNLTAPKFLLDRGAKVKTHLITLQASEKPGCNSPSGART